MESITTTNQTNKEIEEFIEGDYITIREGESAVLSDKSRRSTKKRKEV